MRRHFLVSILEAAKEIQQFEKVSLTDRISSIESDLKGGDAKTCETIYSSLGVTSTLLESAIVFKRTASQINTLMHSVGILLTLPHILKDGEVIEYLSLGAGNSGRPFDLETNRCIAEFKFIHWKGGAESIRQNSIFKDFYFMAEHETEKEKYLYVLGTKYPLKFLNGGRSLNSVMSKNSKMWTVFQERYGTQFTKVREYYEYRKSTVQLVDIGEIVPQFMEGGIDEVDVPE